MADTTYIPTWAGFVYLAMVLDAWNRRVVGWAIGETLETGLMLAALDMALEQRKPDSVIHHSDQGTLTLNDQLKSNQQSVRATGVTPCSDLATDCSWQKREKISLAADY